VPKYTQVTVFTVLAEFKDIPAMGYMVFKALPLTHPSRTSGSLVTAPNVLENAFFRLEILPNGAARLRCAQTGKVFDNLNFFTDQGEAGSAWKHVAPANDTIQNSLGCRAQLTLVRDGPLEAAVRAEFVLRVPRDLESRERGGSTVDLPISTTYTVRRDDPSILIETKVRNTARDHWLRAVFPTELKTDKVYAEAHFDVVERKVTRPDCDDWYEEWAGTAPMQSFLLLDDGRNSFSLISEGLYEYEVLDKPDRPVALSLLRAMWIKLEVSEEKKQILPDKGMQCPGDHTFRYVVKAGEGRRSHGALIREAQEFRSPLKIVQTGRTKGRLPTAESVLEVRSEDIPVTCIKKAEKGDFYVLRGFNPHTGEGMLEVRTAFPLEGVLRLDLVEREKEKLPHEKHGFTLPVPPKRIFTIGLVPR